MVIFTLHLHTSIAQFGSWICILASSMPIRQHHWFTVISPCWKSKNFFHLTPLSVADISILQSGRFSSPVRKIFYITCNWMDKKFPESGRLSNLCTQIGLFSLKIRKSSAESGRVGSSAELYEEVSIFNLHIFGVEITTCSFLHIGKSNSRIKE